MSGSRLSFRRCSGRRPTTAPSCSTTPSCSVCSRRNATAPLSSKSTTSSSEAGSLEFGVWSLEFGVWSLGLPIRIDSEADSRSLTAESSYPMSELPDCLYCRKDQRLQDLMIEIAPLSASTLYLFKE